MKTTCNVLAVAVLATIMNPLSAAESTPLERVTVTATRTETSLADLPVPIIVIDRATIERNAGASLPDLLRLASGIEIAQSGGPGQLATVFLRGTESDHVLVLIDGVELSPGTIGTLQMQNIDPAIIERIEIVKGARSALYGSEAIGGVINIITRRDAERLRAYASAGSFKTHELGAGASAGTDSTAFDVDVSHRASDGIAPLESSDVKRGYDNTSANLRLRTDLGAVGVTLRHYRSEGTTEYLESVFDEATFESTLQPASQDFENTISEVKFDWRAGPWHSQLSISDAEDLLAQNGAPTFSDTDRRVLDWQNDFSAGSHLLTAGLYAENEDVIAENFGRTEADTDTRALYLQDQWQHDAFNLVLAARGTDHERFGNELSWNIDAGWQLAKAWNLRVNAGRAFRAPNATFLFGPFGANPDLEPEISLQSEIALAWQIDAAQQITLAAFDNRIDDMIDFDPAMFVYDNIDKVRIRGVELSHAWQAEDWRGHADITLQKPEDETTGEPLLRRAERRITFGAQRRAGSVDVGFDVIASGERPDIDIDTFQPVTSPGYVVFNLTANWLINAQWSLAARVENALDTEYQTADGYNTAERGVFVTLRYGQ